MGAMSRYPHPIPFGWFQICWPDDVADGGVHRTHNLGRDLEVHRAGPVFTVREPDGTCWPTVVRNGLVMFWWHPRGEPPAWEVPVLAEFDRHPDFSTPIRRHHERVNAFWQELGETAADVAHIQQHLIEYGLSSGTDAGIGSPPQVVDAGWDEPHGYMRLSQPFPTPQGAVEGRIDTDSYGPGLSITWFRGLVDTGLLGCNLPIDESSTEIRFTYVVRRSGDGAASDRLAEAFVGEIDRLAMDDVEIWEHKAYLLRPALADHDGPIMRYRKWARQFYVEPETADVG